MALVAALNWCEEELDRARGNLMALIDVIQSHATCSSVSTTPPRCSGIDDCMEVLDDICKRQA